MVIPNFCFELSKHRYGFFAHTPMPELIVYNEIMSLGNVNSQNTTKLKV